MSRGPSRNPNTGTERRTFAAPDNGTPVVSKHVARKLCVGCVYFSVHEKLVRQIEVRNPFITSNSSSYPHLHYKEQLVTVVGENSGQLLCRTVGKP